MIEYFETLERNRELFENAMEVAREIARKARALFGDCEVYIVGSYARGEHRLSSDLDVLIVSNHVPHRMDFEWYAGIVKKLTDDHRINIHLVSKKKFAELEKLYSPRIRID